MKQIDIFDLKFRDILDLLENDEDRKLLEKIIYKTNSSSLDLLVDSNELSLAKRIKACGQEPYATYNGRLTQLEQCFKGLLISSKT